MAGGKLYAQTCVACHGAGARGDRGPSLVSGNLVHGNADGEIFVTIRGGVPGTQMPAFSTLTTQEIWQVIAYLRSLSAPLPPSGSGERVPGDGVRGKTIFDGKGGCLNCHQVNGVGLPVGPDLSAAAQIPAARLKQRIENPDQPFDEFGFNRPTTIVAKTADGKMYRGVKKEVDSFTVQMIDTAGQFRSFDKAKLENLQVEPRSLMPNDYKQQLGESGVQDVIAYLKTLKGTAPWKLQEGGLTWERILHAQKEPWNYLTYWGGLKGEHFSALDQINSSNVKTLQAKWSVPLPGDGIVESVPLVVDGILYTTGPVGGTAEVLALDAKTGRMIWRYQRKQKVTNPYEINRVNRGVTILGNRLFFGTLDAALVALDLQTGAPIWETQVADTKKGYSITSPPLVVKDKIITGVSGGEFGVRAFIDAYDANTGKHLWRQYTIPGKGEPGNETWSGDSWQRGSAASWLTGTYDPELNVVYWPTGNPGPDFNGDVRTGDNLYSCSVLAIDPDTGERKWFYQFTPNDTHDWDSTENMVLVDREWHGEKRKLLLHADRNGVFYVLDRTNGKLLQASPFVRVTWADRWDANGRPVLAKDSRATPQGSTVYPSAVGGTNFQASSYSPESGWMYFTYLDAQGHFSSGPAPYEPGKLYEGSGAGNFRFPQGKGQAPPSVGIVAFDPETGKAQWRFELAQYGLQSGVLATAGGLVFAASEEGNLIALDARTGKALWRFCAGTSIPSSPMSYSVDGKQYVAVSTANALFSFALPE